MSKMGPVIICSQGIMKQANISKCVLLQLQKNVSCSNYRDNNSYDQSRTVLQNLNKSKPHKEVWNTLWSHALNYVHAHISYLHCTLNAVSQPKKKTKTKNKHCLSSKPHKEVWNTLWSHALMCMHIYHIYIVLECSVSTKKNKKQTLLDRKAHV